MKASRFTDAQKAFFIRQSEEGRPVAEVCRKAGISPATYFNWKKKYAGMMSSEMKRLRALEDENKRLKRGRGRPVARQGDAAGYRAAKCMVRPVRARDVNRCREQSA